jgi:hypothetical protein
MNTNESWIAEQARLLTLEDGFGPRVGPARIEGAATDDEEAGSGRSSSA